MPSAWPYAAWRRLTDADLALEHCVYLLALGSQFYSASAHRRAEEELRAALDDVEEAVRARRLLLMPPPAVAEGDAPLAPVADLRPVPRVISPNVHA